MDKEDLKTLATQFMKNRPATTSRYYVQIWSQREALRISMKCYGTFNINNALKNSKVPTCAQTKQWISDQTKEIQKDFGVLLDDEELIQEIEEQGMLKFNFINPKGFKVSC